MLFASKGIYEGNFERGYKCGWGKMTYPSGNYYEGEWQLEKKHGYGTTHWVNSNEKVYFLLLLFMF